MRIAVVVFALSVVACGDQRSNSTDTTTSSATSAYDEDVRRICNARELSGALSDQPNRRAIVVAQWLGNNVVTPQGRALLAEQARLEPAGKIELLLGAAKAAGLDGCDTAEAWRGR